MSQCNSSVMPTSRNTIEFTPKPAYSQNDPSAIWLEGASARRQQLLIRTVERLSVIRSVEVRSADDPAVRAAGVVRMPDGVGFTPPDDADVRWSGDASAGQPVLVEGSLADVTAVIAQARDQGAAMTATVIVGI